MLHGKESGMLTSNDRSPGPQTFHRTLWRRSAGILMTLVLLVAPLAGYGQAVEKVWRIGWLRGVRPP
jgi:hypothetical protein